VFLIIAASIFVEQVIITQFGGRVFSTVPLSLRDRSSSCSARRLAPVPSPRHIGTCTRLRSSRDGEATAPKRSLFSPLLMFCPLAPALPLTPGARAAAHIARAMAWQPFRTDNGKHTVDR
jgi:hypothetical protein